MCTCDPQGCSLPGVSVHSGAKANVLSSDHTTSLKVNTARPWLTVCVEQSLLLDAGSWMGGTEC